jgi:hypothetical protein
LEFLTFSHVLAASRELLLFSTNIRGCVNVYNNIYNIDSNSQLSLLCMPYNISNPNHFQLTSYPLRGKEERCCVKKNVTKFTPNYFLLMLECCFALFSFLVFFSSILNSKYWLVKWNQINICLRVF